MREKLKSWLLNDRMYYSLVLLLVALGSFALGQFATISLPTTSGNSAAVAMTYIEKATSSTSTVVPVVVSTTTNVSMTEPTEATVVVASKNGTKYHLPTCPGAKRIKPENILTFTSEAAAQAAGYERAANCKNFPK